MAGRPQWGTTREFIFVLLGYAIGIGNLWRFPYLCGRYGGGSFLIPYLLSLAVVGAPTYLLELILGQRFQKGAVEVYPMLHPAALGLGYCCVFSVLAICTYYNVILAWTLVYLFYSFSSHLPWAEDPEGFLMGTVLHRTKDLNEPGRGAVEGHLVLALLLVWLIVFAALCRGIKSTGKVAYVTVSLPIILVVILFFRCIALPGAGAGLRYYLVPRLKPLLDPSTWSIACSQILFSLSPGLGTAIALASYNKPTEDIYRINLLVSLTNSSFSLFGGFVVFSIVGYMADLHGVPVEEVAKSGPGLAFEVFAQAITTLPVPQFWSVLFFVMLLTLGLDSTFAWMESINTFVLDLLAKRNMTVANWKITLATCVVSFLFGIAFCTRGGSYLLDIIDHYCATYVLLAVVCIELILVWRWYGFKRVKTDLQEMTGKVLPKWFYVCWHVTPFITGALFLVVLITDFRTAFGGHPPAFQALGWLSMLIPLGIVFPGLAIYVLVEARRSSKAKDTHDLDGPEYTEMGPGIGLGAAAPTPATSCKPSPCTDPEDDEVVEVSLEESAESRGFVNLTAQKKDRREVSVLDIYIYIYLYLSVYLTHTNMCVYMLPDSFLFFFLI
eukprot:NODE_49_length_2243_cov_249.819508_g42_i0.p1 GENE.NODE_49_length_2243_cov_249.819508_g42_i0~~NODE_49_length_2243_cov_249.819508_g42_i0.p1  ORF type:complete len:611 (-),score=213.89 NODE_49_length_2243_cov_249.819508_g42_i0:334-2166(-)